ncbi:MAG: serine hydrolase [Winogradskyella sp.]|nr:serine hydrolase [Winogradskyella sp.]
MSSGLLFIFASLFFVSCQIGRFVFYNFSDIKDYKIFPSRLLRAGSSKFIFPVSQTGTFPEEINGISIEKFLAENNTVAFLIIKNDTIHYEKYFGTFDQKSIAPSFSIAKSITSILIGCAIDDGLINSVDEPVTNYIPEMKENGFDKVTIKHLLQMTSGLDFNESNLNPFGTTATYYYGLNLRKKIPKIMLENEPETKFEYVSGNTQLLGLVLERALQNKTITQYLQEKLWTPLGMEYDASWSIDQKKNGIEKTFCCINARARDFAKIGRLYKNKGNWNRSQIVSQSWVEESIKLDTLNGSVSYYQFGWWLPTPGKDFLAQGHLGQYIYVNQLKDLIIVRLGENEGKTNWWSIFSSLAEEY